MYISLGYHELILISEGSEHVGLLITERTNQQGHVKKSELMRLLFLSKTYKNR